MQIADELQGSLVIVHPELLDDPAQKQGQIGIIMSAVLDQDSIYVGFGKDKPGLYASDALLVLRNPGDLYRDVMTKATKMETADFKDLFRISLFQQSGTAKDERAALELAQSNPNIRQYSLWSLQEKLGLTQAVSQEIEPEHTFSRGR